MVDIYGKYFENPSMHTKLQENPHGRTQAQIPNINCVDYHVKLTTTGLN